MSATSTRPRSNNRGIWLAKLALLACSTLAAVLLFEIFVRVTGRDQPVLWEPDPQLGWRHIPNARLHYTDEGDGRVQINTLGFRDVERTIQKDPGVFRIAVFGDSTTEAIQVNLEQTFCQLLEKRLRARGLRAEVLNFGVSGYGALQNYLLYSTRGRQFAPDLVLHAAFLDNDVADGDRRLAAGQRGAPFLQTSSKPEAFDVDYSAAVTSTTDFAREPLHTVRRLSALYRMLSAARSRGRNAPAAQPGGDPTGSVPRRFLLYAEPLSREWEEAWQTFDRVVARFSADVRHDGAVYALVSMPAGHVVNPAAWNQLLKDYPAMASRQWDVLSAEKRVRMLADRQQLPLILPTEAFVQAMSSEPLFFQQIGHQTAHGHQIMASVLEAELVRRKLVPAAMPAAR